ncbi:hypothetical protein CK3_02270 [butyrate-producing bacterium SS3/4]|jgi:hypothetical protein|nr:hypothetical protein CK3_02270 [butyrate-producing bacterium SS3/4]
MIVAIGVACFLAGLIVGIGGIAAIAIKAAGDEQKAQEEK